MCWTCCNANVLVQTGVVRMEKISQALLAVEALLLVMWCMWAVESRWPCDKLLDTWRQRAGSTVFSAVAIYVFVSLVPTAGVWEIPAFAAIFGFNNYVFRRFSKTALC